LQDAGARSSDEVLSAQERIFGADLEREQE
jgi:hypothetical protein